LSAGSGMRACCEAAKRMPALPSKAVHPRLAGSALHAPGSSLCVAGSSLRKRGRHPGRVREHPAPGNGVHPATMEHPAGRSGVPAAGGVFPPPRMEHPAPSMDHPGRRREHPGRNGAALFEAQSGENRPKSAFWPSKSPPKGENSPFGALRRLRIGKQSIMAGRIRFRRPFSAHSRKPVSQKDLARASVVQSSGLLF
jgi:hypothetical protein